MQSAALLNTSYLVLLLMESSTEYKFSHAHNKQSLFLFQLGDEFAFLFPTTPEQTTTAEEYPQQQ